jgi:hypothetical protein
MHPPPLVVLSCYPGLKVHHLDPPVITIDNFLSPENCTALMDASAATGVANIPSFRNLCWGRGGITEFNGRQRSHRCGQYVKTQFSQRT